MDQILAKLANEPFSAKADTSHPFMMVKGFTVEFEHYTISEDFKFKANTVDVLNISQKDVSGNNPLVSKHGTDEQIIHDIITGIQFYQYSVVSKEHT